MTLNRMKLLIDENESLSNTRQFENITRELVRRGYNEEEICKIWGGNFMCVFNQVVDYAEHAPGKKL
jgi:microsomal dipeptidase-like Zn-dependent dipeptidase